MREQTCLEYVADDGEILSVPIYQKWKDLPKEVHDRYFWSLQGKKIEPKIIAKAALALPNESHASPYKFYFGEDQTEPFKNQIAQDLHRFMGWFSPYRYDFIRHPSDHSAKFHHANRPWRWKDVRDHVQGRQQIGVIGNQYARYLIFDVDFHAVDTRWELFLARCKAFRVEISSLAQQLGAAWFVECRQQNISGVRFLLLLPKEVWIPKLRETAERFLGFLDKKYPRLASIESFRMIEIFPVRRKENCQGVGCRLPLGMDLTADGAKPRVTITDKFLEADPKTNLRDFVSWVDAGAGNNVSTESLMKFLIRNTSRRETKPKTEDRKVTKQRRHAIGMGALPYRLQGHFKRLLKDFKEGNIPPDTIGKFIAPIARLVHLVGGDPEEVLKICIERWRSNEKDTSFSDRVSFDENELWRAFDYLNEAIRTNNGYQPHPEESTVILQAVLQRWKDRGFDPVAYLLDDAAVMPATGQIDLSDVEIEFGYAERRLLKEQLHPILRGRQELDIRHTYECARRLVAFAKKYPHRELACEPLLPMICAELPIHWHRNKCYAVMRCLMHLGFLKVRFEYKNGRTWLWRGQQTRFNKARTFTVGEALEESWEKKSLEREGYIPSVSIISHFREYVDPTNDSLCPEMQAEYERLQCRVPIKRRQLALL